MTAPTPHVKETLEIEQSVLYAMRARRLGMLLHRIMHMVFDMDIAYKGVDGRMFVRVHRLFAEICDESEFV